MCNAQGVMCSLGTLLLSPPDGQTKIDRHIFIFINLYSSTIHILISSTSLETVFIVLIIPLVVGQGCYVSGQRHFTVRWSNQTRQHTYNIHYILLYKPLHHHLVRDKYLAGRGISPSDGLSSQTNNAYQLNNNYDRWSNPMMGRRISAPV